MDNIPIVKVQWQRYTEIMITCICIKKFIVRLLVKSLNLHGLNFNGSKKCTIVIGFWDLGVWLMRL